MEHLSTLDASFLQAEDADPHVSLAVGALSVISGPAPEFDELVAGLGERLTGIPRFNQVLHTHPLDLAAPEWVDDDAFDLRHHLRRAAVLSPGDDTALFRLVATLMERRLDRDHPLWECWMIEGLENGQWALLTKIHHCIADGIATSQLLARLSDEGTRDSFVSKIHPTPALSDSDRPQRSVLDPRHWIDQMWRTSVAVSGGAARAIEGVLELVGALSRPAQSTGLNGPVTGMRRYAVARVPMKDVTKVCKGYGVTINDVALASITDSYRAALIRRGERPGARSLRTLVPVSVRPTDALDAVDNRVSLLLPYLPVEESDPVEQLRVIQRRLTKAKSSGQREAGSLTVAATNLIPFPVTAWTMRALTRLPQRSVVTVATNVPGPQKRISIMGRPVVQLLPILPIALQVRTGVAILSYADDLVFGITADFDAASDVSEFAAGIERAVARLASSVAVPPKSVTRSKRVPKGARLARDA
ncbi:wax ester/triacylglycerol synthase family O-acyltransferase [Mycobacterium cookii]|uniref:Diacylglycerol O-acyltransferase n=1 Tax=Mycobacterium cookii TaxID=1775 RepID=A0A7I7KUV2_9MYCO|nr:wax ester/triacylglycerol synthase family O-acyltransferase [Mycobacterium cookii]MCV7329956.1 wax ester/triacylglycerol synthase family O-acyltransferase [Mycobacterium cookii]BBX45885.1 diacylglycerol O-acyltransferase [Mycobacterium cookii]